MSSSSPFAAQVLAESLVAVGVAVVQRCVARQVLHVDVGAPAQQKLAHPSRPLLRRQNQQRVAELVGRVDWDLLGQCIFHLGDVGGLRSLFGAILVGVLLLGEEHLDTGELFGVALKRPAYILYA